MKGEGGKGQGQEVIEQFHVYVQEKAAKKEIKKWNNGFSFFFFFGLGFLQKWKMVNEGRKKEKMEGYIKMEKGFYRVGSWKEQVWESSCQIRWMD